MNIDSNKYIMLYGIGAETKLPDSIEISCNYMTGNTQLKKDVATSFQDGTNLINITSKKQKSTDKSHIVNLTGKYHYNDCLFQADFNYMRLANNFKFEIASRQQTGADVNSVHNRNATIFVVHLGKKFAINDNLYLFPQCSVGFSRSKVKVIVKRHDTKNQLYKDTLVDETTSGVTITPELVIGGDLFLPTAIKINPEISFSYLFDTKYSSNNKLNINPKINMEINRFYVSIEADSITESDGRSFLIKLGVLF
jgi:hypothetical protein